MHFQAEIDNHVIEEVNVDLEFIIDFLKQMNHEIRSFCTLSYDDYNYVQCAGSIEKMTIEYRKSSGNSFEHSVLGTESSAIIDATIKYSGGEIILKSNEILNLDDAIEVFTTFYKTQSVLDKYKKRDITSIF